jgi:uncharacterized protein YigE (DUF2233 family)
MRRLIIAAVLLLVCCRRHADWVTVADGIEYKMLDRDLHLVRVDPKRAEIDAVVRPGSIKAFDFAINANFFDEDLKPLGVVMSKGRSLNPAHPVSWQSVFYVDGDGRPAIVPIPEWDKVTHAKTAVQCGPRLVVDGKRNEVARGDATGRSGVCIGPDARVVFFVTDRGSRFDVHQMVEIAADRLQCSQAMLFDGGPSVQMFLRRKDAPVFVKGDERVPAYIVVKR